MMEKTIKELLKAIKSSDTKKTNPYDTSATVTRVENGVAYVHIPGGVDETPVKLTVDAQAGDEVQIRVGGGQAWIVGNATAPPTDNKVANKVASDLSITSKIVQRVKTVAERAARIAGNTSQYFWHTETGTDTGAHITEIPQEDFLADPSNGGGNLLLRSNGLAVRNGLTELSTFDADGIELGDETGRLFSIKRRGSGSNGDNTITSETSSFIETKGTYSTANPAGIARSSLLSESFVGTDITSLASITLETFADDPDNNTRSADATLLAYYVNELTGIADSTSVDLFVDSDGHKWLDINTKKIKANSSAMIVQDTFSVTGQSSTTFYYQHTFNIAKTGYTPIALKVRTNQAAITCSSAEYNGSVTVSSRNNTISNLNLYLDVTYARSELL